MSPQRGDNLFIGTRPIDFRVEEAWPVDRIKRPGNRTHVGTCRANSVESDKRGNVPHYARLYAKALEDFMS